jgi:hypothetical protein
MNVPPGAAEAIALVWITIISRAGSTGSARRPRDGPPGAASGVARVARPSTSCKGVAPARRTCDRRSLGGCCVERSGQCAAYQRHCSEAALSGGYHEKSAVSAFYDYRACSERATQDSLEGRERKPADRQRAPEQWCWSGEALARKGAGEDPLATQRAAYVGDTC